MTKNGQDSNKNQASNEPEWCDRLLLSRIHRLTINKLRQEIESVSPADYMRFLFRWQHISKESRLSGKQGLVLIIQQLQGLALSAQVWETYIFKKRLNDYDPDDLEYLCQNGSIAWSAYRNFSKVPDTEVAEASSRSPKSRRALSRSFFISFYFRQNACLYFEKKACRESKEFLDPRTLKPWKGICGTILSYLAQNGASFFYDLRGDLNALPAELEDGLKTLIRSGQVSGDGISGLRYFIRSKKMQRKNYSYKYAPNRGLKREIPGRFYLHPNPISPPQTDEGVEAIALQLLKRYGIVVREVIEKETFRLPWWRLLLAFRRLEMRGLIRGGRFVKGFPGEQFALPEAVETARSLRRKGFDNGGSEKVLIHASDPLNLLGIITPKKRLAANNSKFVLFENGNPLHIGNFGEIKSKLGLGNRFEDVVF